MMITTIPIETVRQLSEISNSRMKAINDAITEAFPDCPDQMYTAALAFQLCALLNALNPADRPSAVELINSFLADVGDYRLAMVN
jgi:hypothetical protein